MSTEWSNDDIDRIFAAVTAAVLGEGPLDDMISAINEANAASRWPEIVLEDILDAEVVGE